MLQYPVQLPPLSLTSSKPKHRSTVITREVRPGDHHDHDAPAAYRSSPVLLSSPLSPANPSALTTKRTDKRPAYAHVLPPTISTAFPPPSSPSLPSSSLSSHSPSLPPTPLMSPVLPSPVLRSGSPLHTPSLQPKPVPRSPYVQPLPMPVPGATARSPHPLKPAALPSPGLSHAPTSAFGGASSAGSYPRSPSSFSSTAVDVLAPGDLVGEGLPLEGELIRKVMLGAPYKRPASEEPAPVLEVVRVLGTGSYATVYLVREVLYRAPAECLSDDGMDLDMSMDGHGDRDEGVYEEYKSENKYGREYAIKVLSKGNLDQEALAAQMFEARIHQSLPQHPNIVTLYRTLETSAYLLLLLEFVPGEDLFYFLEQARDHYEPAEPAPTSCSPSSDSGCSVASSHSTESTARTPPTPSLLSNLSPSKLLSRTRLKLIASMFGQMCDAVAACHERGVFHRDIKPENFIVTDGWQEVPAGENGETRRERRVVVKLTDFGLSTMDVHSADMDCGSAPYMSYECRNNIHPTYTPRAADVWSLGIVLINMLYHYNPWTDTTQGVCPSFTLFRQNPTQFFLSRFSGMTPAVAEFLATRVFCILPDPEDDAPRVSARDFGQWIRDLPHLIGPSTRPTSSSGHGRSASYGVNIADVHGHRLVSLPHSRRPSLRSAAGSRNPSLLANQRASWALSRAPSMLGPAPVESDGMESGVPASVLEQVEEQGIEEIEADVDQEAEAEANSRSASVQKRRKRGARKGKGKDAIAHHEDTLETLAHASQALARELSRNSRTPSTSGSAVGVPSPLSTTATMFNATTAHAAAATPTPAPVPTITKKPSKWRLGFGKGNGTAAAPTSMPNVKEDAEAAKPPPPPRGNVVNNVANLLDSLNASPAPPSASSRPVASSSKSKSPYQHPPSATSNASFVSHANPRYAPSQAPMSANSSMVSLDDPAFNGRGRRYRGVGAGEGGMWGSSTVSAFANSGHGPASSNAHSPYASSPLSAASLYRQRGVSPASVSQASVLSASTTSSNWRSGSSSAATSTSAFTRYSNGSVRSVSTAATSVSSASSASWRSGKSSAGSGYGRDPRMPANIKCVDGLPWELGEVPRQQYLEPDKVVFNGPPQQRKRAPKPKNSNLDTISERPQHVRPDPSSSTTELDRGSNEGEETGTSPRKVQKGQINALAKMLSALRR